MSKGASRLSRCMRAPIRVLCSVRDLYVKSMTGCAGRLQYGGATMGYPSLSEFSYSFNSARTSASDDDLRELIRASSLGRARSLNLGRGAECGPVRRSQSVVIGRIDEDQPCEFQEDVKVGSDLLFPRSRSFAADGVKRRVRVLFA